MTDIKLASLSLRNFKGIKELDVPFCDGITEISGKNESGKTSVVDAFTWLMFGKDSAGNTSFGIRPVNPDGTEVNYVEISVEAVLSVNGEKTSFKKIQKQKWTKHRGSSAPTYEGNVNSYEIDGFPQSEKEFKNRIAGIISEDKFRLISDLNYFANLDWKDKKKILLSMCGDITDEDVLSEDAEHWEPIRSDVQTAGVDKAREKARKDLSLLNKKQKELPIRIDEVSRQKVDVPRVGDLVERQNDLTLKLTDTQSEISMLPDDNALSELRSKAAELKAKAIKIKADASIEATGEREKVREQINKKQDEMSAIKDKADNVNRELSCVDMSIVKATAQLESEKKEYNANSQPLQMPESKKICPTCGQKLPKSKLEEIEKQYELAEQQRQNRLNTALENGRKIKTHIEVLSAEKKQFEADSEKLKAELATVRQEIENLRNSIPVNTEPDLSANEEYQNTLQELSETEEKITETKTLISRRNDYIRDREKVFADLEEVKSQFRDIDSMKQMNADIENRLAELESEQRETGKNIALTEQKMFLLDEFSVRKTEMLSEKITSCFRLANFSLFNRQINGGITEECEITLKGVKYKDINNGHRIVVALDIINTFQEKLGIHAPVMVDNAESVNDFNIPHMDCQLILLKVTDDPELEVKAS